jgi:CheY-like chemotaxis protein/two-component sensor histidine kinase
MEIELKKAKERAEESDKLKTSFLNNMNHEIRTPLNAIVGFSDLLFEDYTEEEKKSFVVTINNNSEQLLRIIDDVLSISRLDAEHLPLEIESIDLQSLMFDLYNSFSLQCEQKKLVFELDIDLKETAITIIADKGKIRQVMTGFIDNAIKYTPSGKIIIGCQKHSNSIRFFVKDTGLGVPLEEQSKIFDRFYRGNEVQNKALRGNGLGLSISKGLVDIMGGTIGLTSEHGKGSNFYFEIEVQFLPSIEKTIVNQNSKNFNFSDLSLLIVDDEPDNIDLLFALLHQHFGEIGTARNGQEAINLMHLKRYSVILMDIKMPQVNGFEATQEILSFYSNTLIIGQTAYSRPEEIQKMIDCGAKACIVKPIESIELIKILQDEIARL